MSAITFVPYQYDCRLSYSANVDARRAHEASLAPKTYFAQSALDAQRGGYGGAAYCDYLEKAAFETRAYYLKHGEIEMAGDVMARSLSEALRGNDGD